MCIRDSHQVLLIVLRFVGDDHRLRKAGHEWMVFRPCQIMLLRGRDEGEKHGNSRGKEQTLSCSHVDLSTGKTVSQVWIPPRWRLADGVAGSRKLSDVFPG